MRRICWVLPLFVLASCGGVTQDAREICKCYHEVVNTKGPEADEKMKECMELLDRYDKKYKGTGDYDAFVEEYNKCR
ncbi:MAG: hypothetical protein ACOZCO_05995 [Bacteroidota bacterium]